MRVLVCGGRDYWEKKKVYSTLRSLTIDVIIHGMCNGADTLADDYAREHGIPTLPFPADWGQFGAAAGPIRNRKMLRDGMPDLVVAFPGGPGTANMVKLDEEAGVKVMKIE